MMIYDCFTFFNELDVLEIRLNVLKNVADKFVLVEATRTHQGKEKPLYYNENKERFSEFSDKIIHIIVDDYPPYQGKSAWTLERYQRDMIARGLTDCKNEDMIMVSDVDEIPNPESVQKYKNATGVFIFRQKMYCYYLNCLNVANGGNYRWDGTVMSRFGYHLSPMQMRELSIVQGGAHSPKFLRQMYNRYRLIRWQLNNRVRIRSVQNGGWHFTYLGGAEMIIKKLEAFAHTEYNDSRYKNPQKIEEIINSGKDIFGRNYSYRFVPLDDSFPEYILKNTEKYRNFLHH